MKGLIDSENMSNRSLGMSDSFHMLLQSWFFHMQITE